MSHPAFPKPGNKPPLLALLIAMLGVPVFLLLLARVFGQTPLDAPLILTIMLGSTVVTPFVALIVDVRFLKPGNMSPFLAWLIAIFGVPAFLLLLARVFGQTPLDAPLYLTVMVGSTLAMPFVAKIRHRRWWLWGFIASMLLLFLFVLGPIFQPVTVLVAVYLSPRGHRGHEGLAEHDRLATIEATAVEMGRDEPSPAPDEPAVAEEQPAAADSPAGESAGTPTDIPTRPRPRAQRRPYRTQRRPRH